MRLYPPTYTSAKRLRFGQRLVRGLERSSDSAPLAAPITIHNDSLREAYIARQALEPAVEDRSDDVRFAELEAEAHVRRLHRRTQELDGDRVGAATRVGFPSGLTAVIAVKGQSQQREFTKLRTAYAESNNPIVAAHREELVALADKAIALFNPAYDAWVEAVGARDAAFTLEVLRRREHRRAVNSVFGGLRSLFPDDRGLQDALVPTLASARSRSATDDEEVDDAGPTDDPINDAILTDAEADA